MPGSTPVFGFPYPDPSDLVANYPALGQQLAEDVEDEIIASGKIKQVVSATKTDTFTTTSTTPVDITGLSVSITPTSATSKVFVIASCVIGQTDQFIATFIRLLRDSTAICIGDAAGSRTRASGGLEFPDTFFVHGFTPTILDSPATTSAVTYKVQLWRGGGNGTATLNRSGTDNDDARRGRYASTLTAIEVSA